MMVVTLEVVFFARFIVHLLHVLLVLFQELILFGKCDEIVLCDRSYLGVLA